MFGLPIGRRSLAVVIGDEGATLTHVVGRSVRRILFAPSPKSAEAAEMRALIQRQPNTALSILVDVLEQHYREQDLPNVGPFDRGKLLKRRLSQAFPNDRFRAALPLPGESAAERRHLLVGVPETRDMVAWFELLTAAGNPVDRLSTLPIEAVALTERLRGEGDTAPESARQWRLLLSRHRTGGFRQVIIQNGRLVFTRLTPGLPLDASDDEVVETLEREFASTVSYLRRLSFSEADRVDLTVVAAASVCGRLDARRLRIRALRCLTPDEAAKALGLDMQAPLEGGFTEALHAAWFAQHRPVIALAPGLMVQSQIASRAPRAAIAASLVVALAGAGVGWTAWQEVEREQALLDRAERELAATSDAAAEAAKALEGLTTDPHRVTAAIRTYDQLTRARPRFVEPLRAVVNATEGEQARIRSVNARMTDYEGGIPQLRLTSFPPDQKKASSDARKRAEGMTDTLSIVLEFHGFDDPAEVQERFNRIRDTVAAALPGYQVEGVREPFADTVTVGQVGIEADRAQLPPTVEGELRLIGRPGAAKGA